MHWTATAASDFYVMRKIKKGVKMIKFIFGFILPILMLFTTCYAEQQNESFEFGKSFINSLQHLKINEERTSQTLNTNFDSEIELGIASMKNLRLAIQEIQMAQSQISSYENSNNEIVKTAADFIIKAYQQLQQSMTESLELQEKLYSASPEEFNQGEYMSKISALQANQETAMTLLIQSSVLVTHSFVSKQPDEKGNLSYLVLTSKQRKELISELDSIFGKSIKNGMQEGQTHLEACAGALRQVLSGGHKSSDERK